MKPVQRIIWTFLLVGLGTFTLILTSPPSPQSIKSANSPLP